ncbi:uncharacterized protein LOC131225973 [Magnolia sinica]|uniref:uncharacterized protein LOC131225973 n=1 Tax=Magnolia sinica TaxID=86752 RepID=UPI00265B523F|nr:uncharacterized protein LOC131225973 [Magnolia sinica]
MAVMARNIQGPWVIGGDFNTVVATAKRSRRNQDLGSARDFVEAIDNAGLLDAGFSGSCFTWCNNQQGPARVWARLDRVLTNGLWNSSFPNFHVEHLPRSNSDHAPLLLVLLNQNFVGPKPFCFQRMWLQHESFQQVIKTAWESETTLDPMVNILVKLRKVKISLKIWNKEVFGDIFMQIKEWSMESKILREIVWVFMTPLVRKGRLICISVRRLLIKSIELDSGRIVKSQDLIKVEVVRFFHMLFSAWEVDLEEDLLSNIPELVTVEDNSHLLDVPSLQEVKQAILDLPSNGAPSPDGFSRAFFAGCWDIIGRDLLKVASSIFQGGSIPRAFTASLICLLLKCSAPKKFSDLDPSVYATMSTKFLLKSS